MIKNLLRSAARNLGKQKMFSLINLLGLAVGITCCLMIFLFVLNEFSYDNFHKNGKNIYRVMRVADVNGKKSDIPYLSAPYSTALLNDYPEDVQKAVRVMPDNDLVIYRNTSFNEKNVYLADSNFFEVFDFPLLKGDRATVLKEPGSIVMTASTAKKYFGNEEPIGKVISLNGTRQLKVTGIARDIPANSHLQFDIVVPLSNWQQEEWFDKWSNNGLFVYVQLNPATRPDRLISSFPSFMDKYMGRYYKENGFKMDLTIHPLNGIYFEKETPFDHVKHGSKQRVYLFLSIAILILVIACINFINLATARATDRSKEIGLRKVLGALRKQLAGQFIMESLLFATAASVVAVILLQLLMPAYEGLLGYRLPPYWGNPLFYVSVFTVILVVGLLAGSYPALLLSSFSPVESLKGKLRVGKGGALLRKALVVFQFGISVLLIVSVSVIMGQMRYVRHTDLGFNKEQSMIVRLDNTPIWDKKISFKNELLRNPAVQSVSLMSGEPGGFHDSYGFEAEARPNEKMMFNTEYADFEYARTLGLTFIAGRDFSAGHPTDSTDAVLVNRSAAAQLGYTPQEAIGKWLKNIQKDSVHRRIVGVVEDFHFASLKETIGPLVISPDGSDRRLVLIRLKTDNLQSVIGGIGKIYAGLVPAFPFEYGFLDESFSRLYKAETGQEAILGIFSIIAIFIACLGLFGLASYTAVKRTKEIGVRKVLGSSVRNIIMLLSKDLLKPVLLGTLIAVPIGYYAMNRWLQDFAYRVPISGWMFVSAAAAAVTVALLTVSFQAVKAALANPVNSLRSV